MARLYADEDFPGPTERHLRTLGHDVLTARQAGRADQRIADMDVLQFAHQQGRALLTMNRRDYIRLHESGIQHSGIIACTVDRDFISLANRIHAAIQGNDVLIGKLVRVHRPA